MLGMKKQPTVQQLLFKDADLLAANSYYPAPLEFGYSLPEGSWKAGVYSYRDEARQEYPDHGIAVLTGATVNPLMGLDECRRTWLVAVQVINTASKKIDKAVDELMSARFTKRPAVRRTTGTYDGLYVFALDESESLPISLGRSIRRFWVPKDRGTDSYLYCDVRSAFDCFTYSGLCTVRSPAGHASDGPAVYWPEGDLTKIPRRNLPALTYDAAATLQDDIENLFEAHGAERAVS
jgi:hypothetical protein